MTAKNGSMNRTPSQLLQIEELVAANRILFARGIVDAYGHVSVRDEHQPDRFLLTWAIAPGVASADDVLIYDLNAATTEAGGREEYSERFIHAAIYAKRADINGIVHSHSHAVIPFTVTEAPLRPIWHMSAFLADGCVTFDTRDLAGDTDLLIKTPVLGDALAASIDTHNVGLLRGHGSVTLGRSVREAVYRAVYLEENARLQSEAMRLGTVKYLTDGECALMNTYIKPDVRRPWELWLREISASDAASPKAVR
jgi:ribulose-5-phosphate 4-epimerase/fuculose-1-phosphate aldolase